MALRRYQDDAAISNAFVRAARLEAAGEVTPVELRPGTGVELAPGERATAECVLDESEGPVVAVPTRSIVQIGLQPTERFTKTTTGDRPRWVYLDPGEF